MQRHSQSRNPARVSAKRASPGTVPSAVEVPGWKVIPSWVVLPPPGSLQLVQHPHRDNGRETGTTLGLFDDDVPTREDFPARKQSEGKWRNAQTKRCARIKREINRELYAIRYEEGVEPDRESFLDDIAAYLNSLRNTAA